MCYLGQSCVFEDGEKLLKKTINIEMSSRQIQRVSEHYGNQIEQQMQEYNPEVLPQIPIKDKNDYSYIMVDESLLLSKDAKPILYFLKRLILFSPTYRLR